MRVLFMGTPQFAAESLHELYREGFEIVGVVTQPDKPKGRGHKMLPPAVKVAAQELGLSVYQPETLKNGAFFPMIEELKPDVIVVAAYGKILPHEILDFPTYGCLNVHASLLPKYRGAAPIQRCIMDGESVTGVTIMQMDAGLDTGDMLLQEQTPIGPEETAQELTERLAAIGAKLLVKALHACEAGTLLPEKQEDEKSCYAAMIARDTGRLQFNQPGKKLYDLIRAVPAFTTYQGKKLKILKAKFLPEEACQGSSAPGFGESCSGDASKSGVVCGTVLCAGKNGLDIAVSDGVLRVLRLQMEGKKAMDSADYFRGNPMEDGVILGQ